MWTGLCVCERNVEMQIFLFRDGILYCIIRRQGFLGWQDFPGRQDFAGGQDFVGGHGPWMAGLRWRTGLCWRTLSLEDGTSPGYLVSCTFCNLCKDDGVLHACAVSYQQHGFIRGGEETCLKGNFVFTVHGYSPVMLSKFLCYS